MTYWGTSHFVSKAAAIAYYQPYYSADDPASLLKAVGRMIAEGAITIGEPSANKLMHGDRVFLDKNEGRYFIDDQERKS